jgi:hypothetical protein
MTARFGYLPDASEIAAGALMCAVAATLVAACAAAAVAAAGAGDHVRRSLRFDFAGAERTPAAALQIAVQNARLVAAALLCAAVVPRLPRLARLLTDAVLAVLLVANAGLIGVALGAYGAQLAIAIAPHLPLELTALSVAGGAYMHANRHPVPGVRLALVATTCALLVVIAATLETYVALGGAP